MGLRIIFESHARSRKLFCASYIRNLMDDTDGRWCVATEADKWHNMLWVR